jgi:hypothetical protein
MLQQINLYRDILNREKLTPSLLPLGLTMGAGVALLLALTLFLFWQGVNLRRQLATLRFEQTGLVARVDSLTKQYPPRQKSLLLEEQVERLVRARDARAPLSGLLAEQSRSNIAGFSSILEGLARRNPAGLWLRRVTIADGGQRLLLAGSTKEPRLAPRFLQELGLEPNLAGMEFEQLLMERSTSDPGTIDFSLQTTKEVKE